MADKLPSNNVRYRLYIGTDPSGKKLYKSFTARTATLAKKAAEKWKKDHPIKPSEDPTFREAATLFLNNRSKTLSGSTYRDYKLRLDYICELFPVFSSRRMSQIGSEDVQSLVNTLISTRRPCRKKNPTKEEIESMPTMSAKTIANYYSLIGTVLRTQGGLILHDIKLPDIKAQELRIPEEEEIKQLFAAVKGTELEIPVLLAALGPMRRGEIYALDINADVDYINHSVYVHRNYIRTADNFYEIKETPKSHAGNRTITYPAYVTDLIKERGHITTYGMESLTKAYQRKMKSVGLDKYRFHDLRHYSASFQIALGIPPQYVMDRGGWESDHSMKRYIHALDKKRKEFSDQTNAAFQAALF